MKKNYLVLSFAIAGIIFFLSSCTVSKTTYIHKHAGKDSVEYYVHQAPEYKLKIEDVININIVSTNEEITGQFGISETGKFNPKGLSGFVVNDTGYVQVPILGFFQVEGKTIKEVREMVQKRTEEFVYDAMTYVTLSSFQITFIGESAMGIMTVPGDYIDILDAFAMRGVQNGNLSEVLIMRKNETGSEIFKIDLTDRRILESNTYYLYPNDKVIIRELKLKSFQKTLQDYLMLTTSITSILSLYYIYQRFK